jgi:hypothetical protein
MRSVADCDAARLLTAGFRQDERKQALLDFCGNLARVQRRIYLEDATVLSGREAFPE